MFGGVCTVVRRAMFSVRVCRRGRRERAQGQGAGAARQARLAAPPAHQRLPALPA